VIHGKLIGGTRASAGLLVLVVGLLAAAPLGAEAVRALPLVDLSQCCVESTEIMHARYFSPNLGRFVSVDPVGGEVGSSQSWNRYSYVRNNPSNLLDPTGEAVFATGEELKEVGDAVVKRDDLQPVKNGEALQTFCNKGVQAILNEGGDHSLDNMKAADIAEFLSNAANATELSYADAVSYAKQGATVIAAKTAGSGAGHVAVVAPMSMVKSSSFGEDVPVIFNIGKTNRVVPLSEGFRVQHQPKTYILNVDKNLVDAQRALQEAAAAVTPP